ncbi:MAG: hypothetical protein M1814_002996 [Vezdaea aestivalis]|nr:MAG: hypothetical protein M1814_002996 [Vezdaea aestivalis]
MAIAYEDIIASRPFKFIVGPERSPFTVHSAVLSHHSIPLNVMLNGQLKEAREGCAFLEDIDKSIFVRFTQYAYTGGYDTVNPGNMSESPPVTDTALDALAAHDPNFYQIEPPPMDDDAFDNWSYRSHHSKKKGKIHHDINTTPPSKKTQLWESFRKTSYGTSAYSFQARKNIKPCENYTEVFLCHARLYVFADRYDVEPLRQLTLHKLQRTLADFTLYDERTRDVVELVKYTYSNTAECHQLFKRTVDNDPILSPLYYSGTNFTCFIGSDAVYQRYNAIPSVTAFLNDPLAGRMGWLYSCVRGVHYTSTFTTSPTILRTFLNQSLAVANLTAGPVQTDGMPMAVAQFPNGTVYANSAPRLSEEGGLASTHPGPFQQPWVNVADLPFDGGVVHVMDDFFDFGTNVDLLAIGTEFNSELILDLNKTGELTPALSQEGTYFVASGSAYEKFKTLPDDQKQIIKGYTMIPGREVFSDSFLEGGNSVTTSNGQSLTLSIRDGQYYVNDCKIILANVFIVNGVVHLTDCYPVPPGSGIPTAF